MPLSATIDPKFSHYRNSSLAFSPSTRILEWTSTKSHACPKSFPTVSGKSTPSNPKAVVAPPWCGCFKFVEFLLNTSQSAIATDHRPRSLSRNIFAGESGVILTTHSKQALSRVAAFAALAVLVCQMVTGEQSPTTNWTPEQDHQDMTDQWGSKRVVLRQRE